VVSIVGSPILVQGASRLVARLEHSRGRAAPPVEGTAPSSRGERQISGPAEERPAIVILGAGRVGRVVVGAVRTRGFRCVVVDRDPRQLEQVAGMGAATLFGDAASPAILARCGLEHARLLVVAIGDPIAARLAVERALAINPRLTVAARARGRREIDPLFATGVARVADPEVEAALELARAALHRMGVSGPEQVAVLRGLRRRAYGTPGPAVPGGDEPA
jgi:CPA2 family monovalent cation:H+ antiporter-2